MWRTPEILTWDAWLARQWRSATLAGRAPPRQALGLSQERTLWELALQQLVAAGDDPDSLRSHAGALMQAAAQAAQSLLPLRSGSTEEEWLLVEALRRVRRACDARGLVALRLAHPDDLAFLDGSPPPLFVGQPQLSHLQRQLQLRHWPDAQLLAEPDDELAPPVLRRAASLEEEIAACALWCRAQLQEDARRRLLVVSAWQDPGAVTQGAMLWAALAGGGSVPDAQRAALLAVEGGEPLRQQALVDDALAALSTGGDWIESRVVLQLLRSPYFAFGRSEGWVRLQEEIGNWGLARWRRDSLQAALVRLAERVPAADALREWLQRAEARLAELPVRSTTAWAECFSSLLADAGFATGNPLDSREMQRLTRWSELLDEFATLDAELPPMEAGGALRLLQRLAQQASHQPATGDAAITFTTQLHDPVVRHDGIWVMGLVESRWPPPPRPDPYVPLHEQRRCEWPQAGVAQRLRAARWLQQRWRQRTSQLVLSHARQEGDVHHRPSSLLADLADAWRDVEHAVPTGTGIAEACVDRMLPPFAATELASPLAGGVERLRVQQECAFHSQAQWRLSARPSPRFTDGVPPRLRGMLLHSLLEGLWSELGDQRQLLALDTGDEAALIHRHWLAALAANAAAGAAWLPGGLLERERLRAIALVQRVLQLERQRAPFAVQLREHATIWREQGAQVSMRIDRVDETADGEQLLIDYKSGAADAIRLHEGEARPLQLAVYVLALAQQGVAVDGALLLGFSAAQPGFSGAWAIDATLPRVKNVDDWAGAQQQWQRELTQLVAWHLAGSAQLAQSAAACRYCHLPAFCRRRAVGDADADAGEETGAEDGDE